MFTYLYVVELDNILTASQQLEYSDLSVQVFSDFGILLEEFSPHHFDSHLSSTSLYCSLHTPKSKN